MDIQQDPNLKNIQADPNANVFKRPLSKMARIYQRIFRLFCFGLSSFILVAVFLGIYEIKFSRDKSVLKIMNKDSKTIISFEKSLRGTEIWKTRLDPKKGVLEYRIFPR